MHEYVREFSSLLLDVRNISSDDKLFNFLSGLKPWAQIELRRQGVRDLSSAIAAADGLLDLRSGNAGANEAGQNLPRGKGKNRKNKDTPEERRRS